MVGESLVAVTLEDLRAICGTGLAHLHAWAVHETPARVMRIFALPQMVFKPERFVITNGERWRVYDIKINHVSQLGSNPESTSPIPGTVFNARGDHPANVVLIFDAMMAGEDLEVAVEYIGDAEDGEPFNGLFIGEGRDVGSRMTLPIQGPPLRPSDGGRRVFLNLSDVIYRFDEDGGKLARVVRVNSREFEALSYDVHADELWIKEPTSPLVISLHAEALAPLDGSVLFGVDEATGAVVFDICDWFDGLTAKCDLAGYVPTWWSWIGR